MQEDEFKLKNIFEFEKMKSGSSEAISGDESKEIFETIVRGSEFHWLIDIELLSILHSLYF